MCIRDRLGAQHPLLHRQQRGVLVAGPGRIPRLPGPVGEAAAGSQGGRVLGPEHPATLRTRGNLANWTGTVGDAARARDQFAELLPIQVRVSGTEHPDTLTTRRNLTSWTGQAEDGPSPRED